jgi:hypothetical protein
VAAEESRVKTRTTSVPAVEGGGDDLILAALDARMRKIAAETFCAMAPPADVGAVKVRTAARMLDMSEFRVRELVRGGKLKAVRPTPNTLRVPLAEIRRYLEEEKEGQQ